MTDVPAPPASLPVVGGPEGENAEAPAERAALPGTGASEPADGEARLPAPPVPPALRRKIRVRRLVLVLIILFGFVAGVAFVVVSFFRSARTLVPEAPLPPGPRAAPSPLANADTDGDGLTDAEELALGTNPAAGDTDGDGYADPQELQAGYDPLGPAKLDRDRDGLPDADEGLLGTDPRNADTDGDGFFDGKEVANCYDPRQPSPNDKVPGCPPYPGL